MDDKQFLDFAFVALASLRFHPRNKTASDTLDESDFLELQYAYAIAKQMTDMRES